MNKVYICSPLRGDYDANIAAARTYCREAVEAGHLPVAPRLTELKKSGVIEVVGRRRATRSDATEAVWARKE